MAPPRVQRLGLVDYSTTLARMTEFTDARDTNTLDEIWLLEHPPVFTLGMNADRSHVIDPGEIPVVQVDRGGQVTYHGPGQLVVYVLWDLRRAGVGIRELVTALEGAVIDTVAAYGIHAVTRRDAPGAYVDGAKLASVGLRVRRGCSYHGVALNVAMDLEPFSRIDPCGYRDLQMTQVADLGGPDNLESVGTDMTPNLLRRLLD